MASLTAIPHPPVQRAVVLGGGGVAGIAWEIGVAAGLARGGVDLRLADLFVGTSAGSVAGAQLAGGADLERLLSDQQRPPPDSAERFRPYSQAAADAQNRVLMEKVDGDLTRARQRIGAFALRSETPSLAERRAIVAARLPVAAWPQRLLKVVAVDVHSGAPRVFSADDGIALADAVAASCAVPGTWPAVPIGDAMYMDGGIASITNAHVAADARQVVVLAPLGYSDGNPVSGHLRAEVAALEAAGSVVHVTVPDDESVEAMGENVLDPARRAPSADAGLAQGLALAASLVPWWCA